MAKSEPQVEVAVWKNGMPYLRKTLQRFPAKIGRGGEADIHLESPHVSRVHAHLLCEGDNLRLVDAGSTNGFSLKGRRVREVRLGPDDHVELCDFVLRVRRLTHEPLASELSAGWAELLDDEDEGTAVRHLRELPASDHTLPVESVLSDRESSEHAEVDGDDDARSPDLPPLLTTLHEEANALLYGDPGAELGVEVIRAVGDRVYDVALLQAGAACWWGGRPRRLGRLWAHAQAKHFPMVTHLKDGSYRVQAPNDPLWQIFHRGQGDLELHRSGPLVGAQVEPVDQIEIRFGPFTSYVRAVRMPSRIDARRSRARVDPWLLAALLLSIGLHAATAWLPLRPLAPSHARITAAADRFVDNLPVTYLPPMAPPPAPPPPMPQSPPTPPRETLPLAAARGTGPRVEVPPRLHAPAPHQAPAASLPAAPALSVADFKVTGFVAGLPALGMESDAEPSLRGGPTLLRGDALPTGVVLKGGGSVRPRGRLSDLAVSRVVNAHASEVERCYTHSLSDLPGLAGRIEAEWVVDKTGLVRNVRVIYDDIGSPALTRCVRAAVASWVFPPPTGGPASVAFPFVFNNLRR